MAGLILISLAAVILPAAAFWWLFRNRDVRFAAAVIGGQILITPAMIWVAAHEATPADNDPWEAVIGVAIAALIVSTAVAFVLEQAAKEPTACLSTPQS